MKDCKQKIFMFLTLLVFSLCSMQVMAQEKITGRVIDEDGFADFTKMEDEKLIVRYGLHQYDPKCELFPIPNSEMLINKKLVQNPGY